jgi:hypothetical protein
VVSAAEQKHVPLRRGKRLSLARDCRFDVGFLMLGLSRRFDLTDGRRRRIAAFREDDVARHQLLTRLWVIAFVDGREIGDRRFRLFDGRARACVRARAGWSARLSPTAAGCLATELDALSCGDVGLLADASTSAIASRHGRAVERRPGDAALRDTLQNG